MPVKPTGKPDGYPPIDIEWDKVDQYLIAGSNGVEIAKTLGCHEDTLYRRCQAEKGIGFSAYSRTKKAQGDQMLRSKQFTLAMQGDRGMLIWLGKNRLGQSENPVIADHFDGELAQLLDKLKTLRIEEAPVDAQVEEVA